MHIVEGTFRDIDKYWIYRPALFRCITGLRKTEGYDSACRVFLAPAAVEGL